MRRKCPTRLGRTTAGRGTAPGHRASLPKSVEVRQKVVQACADGEVNLQCSSCGREEANCTTGLAALSGLCQGAAADKALCSSWKVLCAQQEHGVRLGAFCFAPPEAAEAARGTMRSAGRGSRREQPGGTGDADSAASSCFQDPTQDTCRSFRYPDRQTEQDIHDMCETPGISMGWMTGCSIARACRDGRLSRGSKVCRPFSVLATLCADMPGMKGCSHDSGYNRICSRGSVVAQCAEEPPLPFLPRTSSTIKNIVAMCHDHSMLGCEQCTQPSGNACPRPLETLSQLCLSMPYMSWCSDFTAMCQAPQGDGRELGAFCLADTHSNYLPPMRMFFHASITDVVLFTSWIPRTGWQYVATLAAVVAMGLLSSALKALRAVAEAQWRSQSARRIVAARLRSRPRPFVSLLASAATPAAEPLGRGCDSPASREERKPPSASLRAFAWLAGAAASSSGCGCCWGPSKAVAEADGERAHDPLSLQSNGWSNSSRSNSTDAADVLERDSDERCRLRPQLSGRAVPPWPVVQPEQDTFMTASQAHQNTVRCAFTLLTTTLDYLLMLVAMTFNVGLFAAVVFGHGLGTLVFAHVPAALSCSVEAVGVPDEEWLGEPHCGAQA